MDSNRIAVTIDTDWAPAELVAYTRDRLNEYGVPATFFNTNAHGVDLTGHEVAIHPDFLGGMARGEKPQDILAKIKDLFPQALGVRGHALADAARFYPYYRDAGLLYASNHLAFGHHGLSPYLMPAGVVQLPYFFEDGHAGDMSPMLGLEPYALDDLDLESRIGLKIFLFHPIHLWLNTESRARYAEAKAYYHDPETLKRFRNRAVPGSHDLFLTLLWFLQDRKIPTATLLQLAKEWLAERPVAVR